MNQADYARERGWLPGTRLAGDEGYGVTVIEITALGEKCVLAKRISHAGRVNSSLEENLWSLDCRKWEIVP